MNLVRSSLRTAKLVAKISGLKSRDNFKRKSAANYIFNIFMEERGFFLKFGQMMSTTKEMADFDKLVREETSDFNLNYFLDVLKKNPNTKNLSVSSNTSIKGSIGTVVQVGHFDGRTFAAKIQIPGIQEVIYDQLKVIGLLGKIEKLKNSEESKFNSLQYLDMFKKTLTLELSYLNEVDNTLQYAHFLSELTRPHDIAVPQIFPDLSSETVLISSWVEGVGLKFVRDLDSKRKTELCSSMLELFFTSFFNHGFIQGDNQEHNFIYSKLEDKIYCIDFGNCLEINLQVRKAIYTIITSLRAKRDTDYVSLFCDIGFDKNKILPIAELIPSLLEVLFEPFLFDFSYNLSHWNLSKKIDLILGENKWWFRTAGKPEAFMLLRAFSGMIKNISILDVNLSYFRILKNILKTEVISKIEESSFPATRHQYFQTKTDYLQIIVIRNGVVKVDMCMPARSILEMEDFLSDETKSKIKKHGILLQDVIKKALASGLKEQTLLHIKEGNDEYKVNLKN